MKLRFAPPSPYVRKAAVVAAELGLEDRIEHIPTNVWAPDTDIGESNPLGKVPTLVLDNGSVLYDSPVVCEYLDSIAGGGLFPTPGPARWDALRLQATGDGILDAAVLRLLESRRPESQRSPDWMARQKRVIDRALELLEGEAGAWGDRLDIGVITVGCALGYLDFRFPDDDWRSGHPTLAGWYETFSQRPSMQATVPRENPPA